MHRLRSLITLSLVYTSTLLSLPGGGEVLDTLQLHPSVRILPTHALAINRSQARFPDTHEGHFKRGYVEAKRAFEIAVWSNEPWQLMVEATRPSMNLAPRNPKPVEHLLFASDEAESFTRVSERPQRVLCSRSPSRGEIYTLDLRCELFWELDSPSDYELPLRFTLLSLP